MSVSKASVGAGTPSNVWAGSVLSLALNRANRYAQQAATTIIATQVKSTRVESLNKAKCRMSPGAIPKLKKSANVSNSLPMREVELRARARTG